ncbi:MAG TPA: L,D-transpeptidase family protein [Anaerolineales bacterium]|nr:L,D-transpeptidase family protein [Anaerolineales bacterium]
MKFESLSRRDFLKLTGLGAGALLLNPFLGEREFLVSPLAPFPSANLLGRVAVQPDFYHTPLMPSPNANAAPIRNMNQDDIVIWLREVIGTTYTGGISQQWVQTPDGFLYLPHVQPVKNLPNTVINAIPAGKPGFWAEVTVPYVDLKIQNRPIAPAIKYLMGLSQPVRLYYGQVVWLDQVGTDSSGKVVYRFNESPGHGYGYGDVFLADATAFRPLTADDVSPINPNVDPATKKIVVDATPQHQTLSCFEGKNEVYFCRISTGDDQADFSTPVGDQAVARKIYSIHMAANLGKAAGSSNGYDTMAVPWPTFFNLTVGAAIHGVFWHNYFGQQKSHGCINVAPEDAKWIFRWTSPFVSLDQSEIQMQWPNVGSKVSVADLYTAKTG